jgi:hypothetical protein
VGIGTETNAAGIGIPASLYGTGEWYSSTGTGPGSLIPVPDCPRLRHFISFWIRAARLRNEFENKTYLLKFTISQQNNNFLKKQFNFPKKL